MFRFITFHIWYLRPVQHYPTVLGPFSPKIVHRHCPGQTKMSISVGISDCIWVKFIIVLVFYPKLFVSLSRPKQDEYFCCYFLLYLDLFSSRSCSLTLFGPNRDEDFAPFGKFAILAGESPNFGFISKSRLIAGEKRQMSDQKQIHFCNFDKFPFAIWTNTFLQFVQMHLAF